jgi:hypothetical protein
LPEVEPASDDVFFEEEIKSVTSDEDLFDENFNEVIEEPIKAEVKKEKKPLYPRETIHKREQKKNTSFIIMVGILALAVLAVLAYYNFRPANTISSIPVKEPLVIERNDQVPVMSTEEVNEEINIDNSLITQSEVTAAPGEIVKISDGFFSIDNKIYTQVSSWQTMSKANKEAEKYRDLGYKSEIQKSLIGTSVWYRVLVGEFSTIELAKEFKNNNL